MNSASFISFIVLLLIPLQRATAAESRALDLTSPQTCAVRLSNMSLNSHRVGQVDQAFCSGTLVNPTTIVTASHCVDQAVSDQTFFVSFNNSSEDAIASLAAAKDAVFSPPLMSTQKQRESYLDTEDPRLANLDFAILKLSGPVVAALGKQCPQLPGANDCAQLKAMSLAAATPFLSAYFYRSIRSQNYGEGLQESRNYFPGSTLLIAGATNIQSKSQSQAFTLSFESSGQPVEIRRGDSGTGLLFSKQKGLPVLVGVQSSTTTESGEVARFAQLCPWVTYFARSP